VRLNLDINEAEFKSKIEKATLKKFKKGARVGMNWVIMAVKAKAVPKAPYVTGNLRRSIHVRTKGEGFNCVGILAATACSYAKFVHNGTGLYGPRGDYIRRGYGFSRGQQPQPFFTESIDALKGQLPQLFRDGVLSAL
jgi:HK97 gp10 family phage protein